jgi:hypothetical protein
VSAAAAAGGELEHDQAVVDAAGAGVVIRAA